MEYRSPWGNFRKRLAEAFQDDPNDELAQVLEDAMAEYYRTAYPDRKDRRDARKIQLKRMRHAVDKFEQRLTEFRDTFGGLNLGFLDEVMRAQSVAISPDDLGAAPALRTAQLIDAIGAFGLALDYCDEEGYLPPSRERRRLCLRIATALYHDGFSREITVTVPQEGPLSLFPNVVLTALEACSYRAENDPLATPMDVPNRNSLKTLAERALQDLRKNGLDPRLAPGSDSSGAE